jgi:hypothetical protein
MLGLVSLFLVAPGLIAKNSNLILAYESFKAVGNLLLTNSDFRVFLSDLNTIGRQVFADTASTLSAAASDAATKLEPSIKDVESVKQPGNASEPIYKQDLEEEIAEVSHVITDGLRETGQEAEASFRENISGRQRDALIYRLKAAVSKLRKRNDYSNSISTIGFLIQRYVKIYSRAAENTVSEVQDDIIHNEDLNEAVRTGWRLISSFGDKEAWKELDRRLRKVVHHSDSAPEYESTMTEFSSSLQKMFMDPEFFDSGSTEFRELKERSKGIASTSPLRQDVHALLHQSHLVLNSVLNDHCIQKLFSTALKIRTILFPPNHTTNQDLLTDATTIFIPLLFEAMQYIPIPRLELSSPSLDLLLENLILEPGHTINNTSFLPFRLNLETYTSLSIRKTRLRNLAETKSFARITIQGLSLRAEDVGFILRTHKPLIPFSSSGLFSLALDKRGIDISLTIEIHKSNVEHILTLRSIRVKIHHLNYTLRKSRLSFLAWAFKPILRPLICNLLERKLAGSIRQLLHAANREVVFARERLRAARVADPKDLDAFVRAVCARFRGGEDVGGYVGIGIDGSANERGGVFAGMYAPGSAVRLWDEEALRAGEVVDDHARKGWRNEIFDVHTMSV